ncbi:hypothetical protein [Burkholderia sp. BCC0397]|uniref:hypothetical protein n=1 Tax=Burkholderia sp. BCC0397 TaxID=486876 RepID=UPI00158AFBB6|nr:hypothetical protein [Burkholderia sp. BCC0397]
MGFVARAWKDPVWSKVIATVITAGGAAFVVWIGPRFSYILRLVHDWAFIPVQLSRGAVVAWAAITLALAAAGATLVFRKRQGKPPVAARIDDVAPPHQIEIHTEEAQPYHELTQESGHLLSTVRVGIKNTGTKTLSNCRVYVEKVSPPASPLDSGSILLENAVFNLRTDDPEHLVDVAAHWDHMNQYRFSAPGATGFYEAMQYMDDDRKRTFVIRVTARECERSAIFEIHVDKSRRLHLKFVAYTL